MPKNLAQVQSSPWAPQFIEAWCRVMYGLEQHGVWQVVPITAECLPLVGSTTFYDIKRGKQGELLEFRSAWSRKASHSAMGTTTTARTSTPLLSRWLSFASLLAISAAMDSVEIHRFDISQAFLWADLAHKVHMRPFEGQQIPSGYCLKLLKVLYGLKNCGSDWHKAFKRALVDSPPWFQQPEFDEWSLRSL